MSYSFTKIEKDKSRTITAAFCFLVFLYFAAIWVISLLIRNYFFFQGQFEGYSGGQVPSFQWLGWVSTLKIMLFAFVLAAVHWFFTVQGLVERIIRLFRAQPPDLSDPAQKMFQNIVEEVCVATGGQQIRGMVIPTMMLNACAFADGRSVPVIAVTKGLLHKLNRAQLEAVVGHEAAHVVSEDSQQATVISSMFELFGGFLLAIRTALDGFDDSSHYGGEGWRWSGGSGDRSRGGGGGRGAGFLILFVLVIMVIVWLVNTCATLMRMFISRQREYRADAVAVKLTRDPLALAEALYIISHRRHSLYEGVDSLQTLFIVNPAQLAVDDSLSFAANLFSTHPPVDERIKILMTMAYADPEVLTKALDTVTAREDAELAERQKIIGQAQGGLWYVQTPGNSWSGPHNLDALTSFEWLTPQTPVKRMGETAALTAGQLQPILNNFKALVNRKSGLVCPSCGQEMREINYERLKVLQCASCEGLLLNEDQVGVTFTRTEMAFDDRVRGMAKTLLAERLPSNERAWQSFDSERAHYCAKSVNNPVRFRRRIFNQYYPVEIDKCPSCGVIFFDKDELEVMQCMYEIRNSSSKMS